MVSLWDFCQLIFREDHLKMFIKLFHFFSAECTIWGLPGAKALTCCGPKALWSYGAKVINLNFSLIN